MKKIAFVVILLVGTQLKGRAQTDSTRKEKERLLYIEIFKEMAKFPLEKIDNKLAILSMPQISTDKLNYYKVFFNENGLKSFDKENEWEFINNIDSLGLSRQKPFNFQCIKTELALNKIHLKKGMTLQSIFTPFVYSKDGLKASYMSDGYFKTGKFTSERTGLTIYFYQYLDNEWKLIYSEPLTLY
ncbi:hypothetical protein [Pedobacter punctiformis]|uniref:Nuclear transport factor 2 family protein n=1 Tax=Pedobacter punctiformis TaxID=3004097 RepID=A0ABT4LAZ6_9SPHI|nr:hypothetical protein [Pedobacter sp. HCMS5-2]MCZ4245078.1 hypothetical protein [Pedobacter sp. HCMS5-2]